MDATDDPFPYECGLLAASVLRIKWKIRSRPGLHGWLKQRRVASMKVCARYLMPGDVIGSGETVKQTSAGVRTPRGKIEIVLEKDGKRRLAIWGASTTINVQRMEQ